MLEIRYVQGNDKNFLHCLDKNLSVEVLLVDDKRIGLLRYDLLGIIRHFAQCFIWMKNIRIWVMAENVWNIEKTI